MTAPTTSPDTGGEADGWIEWSGGENPAAAREVFIKMRRYGAPSPTELRADLLDWHWRSSHRGADIIAYRLATPTPRKADGWQDISTAPRDGTEVLIWNAEGAEIAHWAPKEDDGPDQPGCDAGWHGSYAWPGRSWGTRLQSFPQGQPTHWMPLPAAPTAEVK